MRRRPDDMWPPVWLTVFDGREFAAADARQAGFDIWCDVREAWAAAHPVVELPRRVLSDCPWDPKAI